MLNMVTSGVVMVLGVWGMGQEDILYYVIL